ncbi:MAG: DUF1841 family protein [Calditrichaeota bacterium]|nr:MAG: DUF1841 family protein [Calditrichota bacterium]
MKKVMKVVTRQLESNDPPEVREALERLMAQGASKKTAKKMICGVMTHFLFDSIEFDRPFDVEGYLAALKELPKFPWEKE